MEIVQNGNCCRFGRFLRYRKPLAQDGEYCTHRGAPLASLTYERRGWKPHLDSRIICSTSECRFVRAARYCKMSFVASVLPAPLSPLLNDWGESGTRLVGRDI